MGTVAIVKYDQTANALRKAIELCDGFEQLKTSDRVLIKPNAGGGILKGQLANGVTTTVMIMEDLVALLREYGCTDITVGEGPIILKEIRMDTQKAYERSGMFELSEKLGVPLVDFNEEEFVKVDLEGTKARISKRALEADFLINVPVMKAHRQSVVSLGLKNMKGCLHNMSKRHFHRYGLHRLIAVLGTVVKPDLTIIDGIYALHRGPWGTDAPRLDLIVAGKDVLSCDIVGSTIIGIEPNEVPHLREFAELMGRSLDVADIDIRGERVQDVATKLEYKFGWVPTAIEPHKVKGITMEEPEESVCTACGMTVWMGINSFLRENEGATFDNMEFCVGVSPKARKESNQVFLFGNCAIGTNRNYRDAIRLKGCPPTIEEVYQLLKTQARKVPG